MISTHILDTSAGRPAAGVAVTLEKKDGSAWRSLGNEKTNPDGRIAFSVAAEPGIYRLTFAIDAYFKDSFFQAVPLSFRVDDVSRKYHVPLLVSPYGLSSYRGS